MKISKPLVSVIIVTLNNKDWLKKSLKNLFDQNYENIEVFVIDNGSKDDTPEMVKKSFPMVNLIEVGENIGFGAAANKGLRKMKGKYAFIYNDDAFLEDNTLEQLVEKMEDDPELGACQGTILFSDKKHLVESAGSFLTPTGILLKKDRFKYDRKKEISYEVFNANLPIIRKSVLDEVGLFDEDYFLYFEEADLCWRIWLAGYKIKYFSKPHFYHARGVTTKKLKPPLIIESAFSNRINSLLKNFEPGSLVKYVPLHLIICFGGSIAYLLKMKPKGSLAILMAAWKNVRDYEKTLDKRRRIQKTRKIRDKDLFDKVMRPMDLNYFVDTTIEYLRSW